MDTRFAENVEINLYRIAQELVNNILKHSGATELNIRLFRNSQHLVLMVEDNGKGFNFEILTTYTPLLAPSAFIAMGSLGILVAMFHKWGD